MSELLLKQGDPFPDFMGLGSDGIGASLLLAFLIGWGGNKEALFRKKLVCDGKLGPVGMLAVKYYQNDRGLNIEEGCGNEMREHMRGRYGFDLEDAIRKSDGVTTFVQLNGEKIVCYHGLAAKMREIEVGTFSRTDALPKYLEKDSIGVAANLLLLFLQGWYTTALAGGRIVSAQEHEWFSSLAVDGVFGQVGVECLKIYQRHNALEADGGFGPASRAFALKQNRFNFEKMVQTSGGVSVFVQLNGERIMYPPTRVDATMTAP